MSAPEAPGVTIAAQRVVLHQVSARRGVELGLPAPGASATLFGGLALGIAPGTVMVLGARPELEHGQAAVVDLSGGFLLLRLAGPAAAEVLARGCRLDLHQTTFPMGAVARTPIAQVTVIVYRAGPSSFDLLVPASLAHSFRHFLTTAASGFGCAVLPDERDDP